MKSDLHPQGRFLVLLSHLPGLSIYTVCFSICIWFYDLLNVKNLSISYISIMIFPCSLIKILMKNIIPYVVTKDPLIMISHVKCYLTLDILTLETF